MLQDIPYYNRSLPDHARSILLLLEQELLNLLHLILLKDAYHIKIAETLSLEKAKEVQKSNLDAIIIGSDQVLSFEDEIFDKPMSEKKAIEQLSRLQGKSHQLITSFSVIKKEKVITETVIANMHMKKLENEQIINYVKKDMPLYCCGSYKLESLGISLFDKIECEDDTSIIGLPLLKLIKALESFDLKLL